MTNLFVLFLAENILFYALRRIQWDGKNSKVE